MKPERWGQVKKILDEALSMGSAQREAFLDRACASDKELRSEVESLLASHEQAGTGFLKSPVVDLKSGATSPGASITGRRIGVYQVIEEIGHGGMGEVYRAARADGQYTKEVAIKLVRGSLDSRFVTERFLNERQILASLDHPNIARLLDGGTTDDGIPYLVMELIEGEPIDRYCDEHKLSVTERLRLFRQVCVAVHYAHQRLVIHRDIKPSNVMVTKEGEPKLLDFGIAKIVSPIHDAQTTFTLAMTPEYASPEQIRGEAITTATDVYSLGVVLYQLLTGRSPYPGDTRTPHKLAQAVCETEPGRPSTVVVRRDVENGKEGDPEQISSIREGTPAKLQRRLGGDLDDITMMALRKEPARRYSSVEQFAEDIRRHLDGLPVAANKGSWSYRAEKFVQRHKVGIAAVAVVLLAVAGGVGATIREARIARANAQRAEKRFNDVRKLANSFLFEFHDAVEHLQGATPARELVVKRALEYLDSLSQEAGTDASLQKELATAYERVGNVQGGAYRDSLGNYQGALESFRKARTIREQALEASPEDEILRSQVAQEYGEIGGVLEITGNLKGALESYKNGLDVLAASQHPNIKTRIRGENLYDRYANALAESGDLPAAVLSDQKSIDLIDEIIKEDPSDHENIRDLAISSIHLGDSLRRMRQLSEALATYRRAHVAFQSIVEPANAQSKRDVNVADSRIAGILRITGNIREGLAVHQSQLLDDMAAQKADPSNVLIREDVYIDYNQIAEDKLALGEIGEALFNERKGIALDEAEVTANADDSRARDNLQSQYFTLGKILRRSKLTKEALAYFAKARAIAASQTKANPKDLDMRANFAESEMEMSEAQFALGNSPEALAGYLDANSVAEEIVAASPTNSEWRILLARTDQKLGEYYAAQARKDRQTTQRTEAREKALGFYRKSLDLWKDLQGHNALGADYNASPGEIAREIAACQTPLQH